MPEGERGERKLSDEEPGKAPRPNSAIGRTKMGMEDAKTSGISFFRKAIYINFSLEVKDEVS